MFTSSLLRNIRNSRAYDAAMRLPVALYSFYALGHDLIGFCHDAQHAPAAWAHIDLGVIAATLARVSQWMFVALLGLLPLIRHRPVARSQELLPRLVAFVAVLLPPFCMLLPRAPADLAFDLMSVVASLTANVLAVLTLSFLGRSFSVMPEARRLVSTGPYGIVRHPLYLFELLGVIGILLQVRSETGVAALVLIATLQFARAGFEEAVLARAIPEFTAYREQVPFLLPDNPLRLLALLRDDPSSRRRGGYVMSLVLALAALVMAVAPAMIG